MSKKHYEATMSWLEDRKVKRLGKCWLYKNNQSSLRYFKVRV